MRITLKLYATLSDYLPVEARKDNRLMLEVAPGATVHQVVRPYGLPEKLVHLVLINGVFVPPSQRATQPLREGDTLAIWPPIAGG